MTPPSGGFDPRAAVARDLARRPGGLTLVLGGARSGKSSLAEGLVLAQARMGGGRPVYIATAQVFDDEMAARIAAHRERRGPDWLTREAPHDLPEALDDALRHPQGPVLVDCLTLWLATLMMENQPEDPAINALEDTIRRRPKSAPPLVLVSNEVGQGIVPENALARRFRDAQGHLNQSMATLAHRVVLAVAGLPLVVKDEG